MKAVFLDRDDTISRDIGYCSRVEDFEILPSVDRAIKLLNQHGFKVVVVTNQSGVARGYFTEAALLQIHQHMVDELTRCDARIDAIYYCPHHPDDHCQCRKPEPGLLLRAAEDLGIDLAGSFMIGDTEGDIKAGKAAGCRTVLVTNGSNAGNEIAGPPDQIAENMLQAVQWILGSELGDSR